MTAKRRNKYNASGFTLIELLVVVGLIALLTAASLPAISNFVRNYRIRGASQALAGEIQAARSTAIKKNVNTGVVFLVTSPTTYRYLVEAPPPVVLPLVYDDAYLANADNADRVFPERALPPNVRFATTPAQCPTSNEPPIATAFAPTGFGLRFTRLGAFCAPGAANCPDVGPARTNVVMQIGGGSAVLCLFESATGLSRTLVVAPSGQLVDQK